MRKSHVETPFGQELHRGVGPIILFGSQVSSAKVKTFPTRIRTYVRKATESKDGERSCAGMSRDDGRAHISQTFNVQLHLLL